MSTLSELELNDLLKEAQSIINKHHKDESNFFSSCNFRLFFQDHWKEVYGYIDGTYPEYGIGLHIALKQLTYENARMIIIVLVHELLHAIHSDWNENQVQKEERRLANLEGYFDSLIEFQNLYLTGKLRMCGD